MTVSAIRTDEAKAYLRIDHYEDDALIELLCQSATELASARIRRPIVGNVEDGALAETPGKVPASVKMAVMVIVAFMYEHRDATDDELRQRVLRQVALDQFIDWEA